MKRSKLISLASLVLAGAVLTSCAGLSKMKKDASNIKYQVSPEVLEAHADMVDVKVTVNIPAKYFNKNAVVVATPVLKFEGGEKAFPSKTLQGEKFRETTLLFLLKQVRQLLTQERFLTRQQ